MAHSMAKDIKEFQFHKGTIKTLIISTNDELIPHFNSIKVRLKRAGIRLGSCFPTFQFHKGTIKTR